MLSDVTIKGSAMIEVSMYATFKQTFPESSCLAIMAGTGLCVTDVAIDTAKYPIVGIEQLAMSVINAAGAACFEECSLKDALWSLKNAVVGLCVAAPAMTALFPLKLLGHLCTTLPNLKQARPSNLDAPAEARLDWFVYPKRASASILA